MKKLFLALPFLLLMAFSVFTHVSAAHPSGKTVLGDLDMDNPMTVADGEKYWIQLSGAPVGVQAKLWVDSYDGRGFRDFGYLGTTTQISTAYGTDGGISLQKTLSCNSYEYLEPGQSVSVGNRNLYQRFYVEYVGQDKVSSVAFAVKDCMASPSSPQSTGNSLFPYTLESVWGRNNIVRPFPDSYASGVSSPLKAFAGRYFDGDDRGGDNMGLGFEWYGLYPSNISNDGIKMIGDKIYIPLSSTIAKYNGSSFIAKLANNTNNSLAVFAGTKEPNSTPKKSYDLGIAPWDAYVYPEHEDNAWTRPACDCHTGITAFDADDRGYIYFNDQFGFGIARDAGSTLQVLVQIAEVDGLKTDTNGTIKQTSLSGYGNPAQAGAQVSVIKTGGKYYAVLTGGTESGGRGGTRIIEVTDPLNPQFIRSSPTEWIRNIVQAGETVAVTSGTRSVGFVLAPSKVQIYTASDFINGMSPKKEFSAGSGGASYLGLAVDKTSGKFYSTHYSDSPRPKSNTSSKYTLPKASISVFSPSAGSYSETKYDVSPSFGGKSSGNNWAGYQYIFTVEGMDFGNGYLVANGQSPEGPSDIKIWIFQGGVPSELDTRGFVKDYYEGLPISNASVRTIGAKDYLFIAASQVGDVYELEPVSRDVSTGPDDETTVEGNGCEGGNAYSTTTGHPCVCVLNPPFTLGTRGEDVKTLQRMLRDAKFYFGRIDGIYGPMTNAAALAHCSSVLNPIYTPNPPAPTTNISPVISLIEGPSSLGYNALGSWKATASDENLDDLAWSVDWGEGRSPMFCKLSPGGGASANWTYDISHAWTQTGSHTFTVYASDCKGGNASKTFNVSVSGSGGSGGGLDQNRDDN